jgi:hypothetical protein
VRIVLIAAAVLALAGCGGRQAASGTTTGENLVVSIQPEAAGPEGDQESSLYCRLGRDGRIIEVMRAADDPEEPDPLDECASMIRKGWELLPLDEMWQQDAETGMPGGGGCFAATSRYELEVEGVEQPQRLCDSVADRYLPAPVAYRTLPVPDDPELLADVVCEASQDDRAVRLLRTPGVPKTVDEAGICDALERDGWNVVRWG